MKNEKKKEKEFLKKRKRMMLSHEIQCMAQMKKRERKLKAVE